MLRRLFDLVYAPLAAALLPVALFPFCIAIILGPTLAIRREIGRAAVRIAFACIGVRIRVRGRHRLPQQACIVVANHASYVDGPALTAALPRQFTFVVQDGAGNWPIVGHTIRRMGVSFVSRSEARAGAKQTRALIRRLCEGDSIAVFAEGTFKSPPGLLPFKTGAFLMAARAGVPVVPVVIRGTRRLWGGGRRLPRWSTIDIEILDPIAPQGDDRPAAVAMRDAARARVLERCGEPDRAHHHTEH